MLENVDRRGEQNSSLEVGDEPDAFCGSYLPTAKWHAPRLPLGRVNPKRKEHAMLPPNSWTLLSGTSSRPVGKVYDIPPVVTRRPRRFRIRLGRARRGA
jgi:hypothetical protein